MITCPYCEANTQQIKVGKNDSGSQRMKCQVCGRRYTPEPKEHGYPETMRRQAIEWYVDGMNLRRIARHLKIHHKTVMLWVNAYAEHLPPPAVPALSEVIEQDELFTFIGEKKTPST